ncbi:MAG: thioredoxin family protein [Chlamydia sp.]
MNTQFLRLTALILILFFIQSPVIIAQAESPSLPWIYNYEAGLKQAQEKKIPIYLLFTAPEWCSFCRVMDEKIHSSPEFIKKMKGESIFIQIILPKSGPFSLETKMLVDRFQIVSVPTELLLTSDGNEEIMRFGYTRMNPSEFADHILSCIKN